MSKALMLNTLSDRQIVTQLQADAVGVLPTDTIYGIVAQATNKTAVTRLYKLKSRDHKPGTVIAANISQLEELGLKHRYLKAVEDYWPNPLSIIIPSGPELEYLHQGKLSLAVRIPGHKELRKLLEQTGPLLTTSANHPGQAPANTLKQAQEYFGDKVDFYVEGGDLSDHEPSTVIRIIDDEIEVLRPGAVAFDPETGKIIV